MTDVELLPGSVVGVEDKGRWVFTFRHKVTGTEVQLEIHGIDDLDAYRKQYLFDPKIYWRGSSCAEPELEDFAAEGFKPLRTFIPESGGVA